MSKREKTQLSKKDKKQIILRKLQYDQVKTYARWYFILLAIKLLVITTYIYVYQLGVFMKDKNNAFRVYNMVNKSMLALLDVLNLFDKSD